MIRYWIRNLHQPFWLTIIEYLIAFTVLAIIPPFYTTPADSTLMAVGRAVARVLIVMSIITFSMYRYTVWDGPKD